MHKGNLDLSICYVPVLCVYEMECFFLEVPLAVANPGGLKISIETPFGPLFQQCSALCLLSMLRYKQTNFILFISIYIKI